MGYSPLSEMRGSVSIAPRWQAGVDIILIGVNQRAWSERIADDRFDRYLPHIWQHMQNHLSAALDQTKDRRLVLFQRASTWRPSPVPSTRLYLAEPSDSLAL
jgi:hypothetical protein